MHSHMNVKKKDEVGFSHLYAVINLRYSSFQEKSKSCFVCWLSCQIVVLIIKAKTCESLFKEELSDIWDSDSDVAEDSGILKCEHLVSGESLPNFEGV
jgi:hypothetical protein